MILRVILILLLFASCATKSKRMPNYISFKIQNDSILFEVKNTVASTSFLKIEDKKNNTSKIIDFKKPDTLIFLRLHISEVDTADINKRFTFKMNYGASFIKEYDSLYNYNLPFLKGKKYKVLQSQNGSFTHKGQTSRYAIDFKMNIGQEVCAIRDGVVISVKSDSNEGGSSKKYKSKANMIFVFHKDGTFSQYAHFKKDGVLVKAGDSIKKGQIIGYSGNTGMSTEPHLHFVVYKPTNNGLASIPYILDSIPSLKYKKGMYAMNN